MGRVQKAQDSLMRILSCYLLLFLLIGLCSGA